MNTSSLETLTNFCQHMYQLFNRRRDPLFDLTNALLTTGSVLSPAHLSLAADFQRGWGNIYDALVDGQIDGQAVETLLTQHPVLATWDIRSQKSVWITEFMAVLATWHIRSENNYSKNDRACPHACRCR